MNETKLIIDSDTVMVASECVLTSYQTLLNSVYDAEMKYLHAKNLYEKTEARLWIHTDFEAVLEKSRPTEQDKKMYCKEQLLPLKETRDAHKANLDDIKRMYELAVKYGLEVLQ